MSKKLRIDIDLPENFDPTTFKFGFTINLSFGKYHAKLIRNKRPFVDFHDEQIQLQASIINGD